MFLLTFEQLVKMFFIMLLAIMCYKLKLVTQEGNKSLSNLLLMVVNPCVILTVYQTDYDPHWFTACFSHLLLPLPCISSASQYPHF